MAAGLMRSGWADEHWKQKSGDERKTIFSPELAARFDKLVTLYPVRRSALIPMLLYAQDEVGYLSDAVDRRRLPSGWSIIELDVRNVMSYYSMLRTKPVGQIQRAGLHEYQLHAARRYELLEHCKKRLGIGHKQTTADGVFSLEEVECIGACCWAPAVQVNYDFHENLTPESMDRVLDDYRARPSSAQPLPKERT